MHEKKNIVINTGPIISLVSSGVGLAVLDKLYSKVYVPREVCQEILVGGEAGFAVKEFDNYMYLTKMQDMLELTPHLKNSLDIGEASVIQLALNKKIDIVCIDESVGRRIARLYDLNVTGSIGILLKAVSEGHEISIEESLGKLRERGVYLADTVVRFALNKEKILKGK